MKKVLITGANGFVGTALVKVMTKRNMIPIMAIRKHALNAFDSVECFEVGDLSPKQDWSLPLKGIDSLVHLAARVHVMRDDQSNSVRVFRKINTESTLNLARQAVQAGVKRFIFLSTIKVNGESTIDRTPFSEDDVCQPSDPYAISKQEAEIGLEQIAKETGMEVVIIRPPLIYGPGVKGNFASMMWWVGKGIPLPLGAVKNKRSFLALDNLVDFINLCLVHSEAAGQIFLLSDGEDISTTELIQKLAIAQDKKARLVAVPSNLIRLIAKVLGKSDIADRLFGSLQVNNTKAQEMLGWRAPVTIDEQLKKVVEDIN